MVDLVFLTGQALSIIGLAYGWFIVLTYRDPVSESRVRCDKAALLHHLAMA